MRPIRGYIEGYYGRLLDWSERKRLVHCLSALTLSHYFYAPKEDVKHRYQWRRAYGDNWRNNFSEFCHTAAELSVRVVAGVAPGLDFDFAHLGSVENPKHLAGADTPAGDFTGLVNKAKQLLTDGANTIALLMDDIDEDFANRAGGFCSEGQAHAHLANRLSEELGCSIWVVPRVYADNIAAQSPAYLPAFLDTLHAQHTLVYCGKHIIAAEVCKLTLQQSVGNKHKLIVWDNLYANDYCPRRLFVGPFMGRDPSLDLMLNPTGMPETDCLLLALMQASLSADDALQSWSEVLRQQGIPDAFFAVAPYFDLPAFCAPAEYTQSSTKAEQLAALEVLLWKWKTPLSREWYPWLMGLKQDLLLADGRLSEARIDQTQPLALATLLKGRH